MKNQIFEKIKQQINDISPWGFFIILMVFSICIIGALLVPVEQCPDEFSRNLLTEWIYKKKTLPTGYESEIIIPGWGFSYASRPYLAAIISACFMKIIHHFTWSEKLLLLATRLCSCCSIAVCCFFSLKLGNKLFKDKNHSFLYAVLICFLPQVLFIGMYHNNDSLSLAAMSMLLYYMADGRNSGWRLKSCLGFSISVSVGLLSYYTIYGWILIAGLYFIITILRADDPDKWKKLILKGSLIAGISILLTGWFFVRNAMLYHGDFLGIKSEADMQTYAKEQGLEIIYDYQSFHDMGYSLKEFLSHNNYEFLRMTFQSFIGVFGMMGYFLPDGIYCLYHLLFLCFILLYTGTFFHRKRSFDDYLFPASLILSCMITFTLHLYQSYYRDYQPQGRYIITLIILLSYMGVAGLELLENQLSLNKDGTRIKSVFHAVTWFLTAGYILLLFYNLLNTMSKMIP